MIQDMKYLSILGSTGSIGTSALDIVRMHPHLFGIKALACANNISLLARQIREFKPEFVCVIDENKALELSRILKGEFKPQIVYGEQGFIETALYNKSNIVLLAMVGAAGLKPALAAIEAKKHIALANKETLVMAGEIVMAKGSGKPIFQFCLWTVSTVLFFNALRETWKKELETIFLTASGWTF